MLQMDGRTDGQNCDGKDALQQYLLLRLKMYNKLPEIFCLANYSFAVLLAFFIDLF